MSAHATTQASANLFARSAKVGGPIAAISGAIADVATPLADFAMYLTLLGLVVCAVSGYVWFGKIQRRWNDDVRTRKITSAELTQLKATNKWGVIFAFSVVGTMIMGGFWIVGLIFGAQKGEGDNTINIGLLGNLDAIEEIQEQIFKISERLARLEEAAAAIKRDTESIKTDTTTIKEQQEQIGADLKDIKAGFETLQQLGALKANPATPQDFYHNATVQITSGNESEARKSLERFLRFGAEYIDPHMEYQRILKSQEGLSGAREVYAELRPDTLSTKLVRALLKPREQRIVDLLALIEAQPDFAPAWHQLADQYSYGKADPRTFADMRKQRDYLQKFLELDEAGQFQKYFLNKKVADEWREAAVQQMNALALSAAQIDKPMSGSTHITGNTARVSVTVMEAHTEIQYRRQGEAEFKTTGHVIDPSTNQPMIHMGRPVVNAQFTLENVTGPVTIEVRYVDLAGHPSDILAVDIDPIAGMLAQAKHTMSHIKHVWFQYQKRNGKLLINYAVLAHEQFASVIREIHFSVDSEALDQRLEMDPDMPFYEISPDATAVTMKIIFIDGSESDVMTYRVP